MKMTRREAVGGLAGAVPALYGTARFAAQAGGHTDTFVEMDDAGLLQREGSSRRMIDGKTGGDSHVSDMGPG